jgi:thiamine pyrophosphokinase
MSICRIIGAGECRKIDFKKKADELIIAADGGCVYLKNADIVPDIIIGDFDSLGYVPAGNEVIKLNPVKDITDMDAAVKEGIDRGYTEFHLYGACGGRIDHTLANIQLVASLSAKNFKAFIHDESIITAVTNGEISFDAGYKGYISVFSHSDKSFGVTIEGLKYTLCNAEFSNLFPLGVSNEFVGTESKIKVENGTLIVIFFDDNY